MVRSDCSAAAPQRPRIWHGVLRACDSADGHPHGGSVVLAHEPDREPAGLLLARVDESTAGSRRDSPRRRSAPRRRRGRRRRRPTRRSTGTEPRCPRARRYSRAGGEEALQQPVRQAEGRSRSAAPPAPRAARRASRHLRRPRESRPRASSGTGATAGVRPIDPGPGLVGTAAARRRPRARSGTRTSRRSTSCARSSRATRRSTSPTPTSSSRAASPGLDREPSRASSAAASSRCRGTSTSTA